MSDLMCDKCKYKNCGEDDEPCVNCSNNYTSEYKPMTQGDKIRAMSDEELAEFLIKHEYSQCNSCIKANEKVCLFSDCDKNIFKWLQSEVKESE